MFKNKIHTNVSDSSSQYTETKFTNSNSKVRNANPQKQYQKQILMSNLARDSSMKANRLDLV